VNGILLIDKPAGWTSSDVVAKLRGILRERRVGHSGTLDPMATGLLVIFVGRATRAAEFAEAHDKRYLAGLRLGAVTDTQDVTGKRIGGCPRDVSEEELEEALAAFRGTISQIPPMYSAVKHRGQKLYEIARRGGEVERRPRQITVHSLRIAGRDGEDFLLDVRCSKGTYVRTLCHELGQALGCGGCMSSLRRLQAGDFSVEQALTLEQLQRAADEGRAQELLLPVDVLFSSCPELTLPPAAAARIKNGNPVSVGAAPEGRCRVYGPEGEFLALGVVQDGRLRTIKSFFEV